MITRLTRDLDYFGTSEEGVAPLADALESRLAALGYTVERIRSFPGFARLRVSTAENSTEVDLGWDARLSPPERAAGGLVLSEAELAADKVLTVADRGEARDYMDLAGPSRAPRFLEGVLDSGGEAAWSRSPPVVLCIPLLRRSSTVAFSISPTPATLNSRTRLVVGGGN